MPLLFLVDIFQMAGIQGQLLSHQGNTYLVQGSTVDSDGHPLTHTTRASPATVSRYVYLIILCSVYRYYLTAILSHLYVGA